MATVTTYPAGAPPPYNQGQPQFGQSQFGQPQFGQPQFGQPQYGQPQSNVVVIQQPGNARVVGTGGLCPYCGLGYAHENISVIGILLAILFFPLGIICCLMMTERRCTHCRATL